MASELFMSQTPDPDQLGGTATLGSLCEMADLVPSETLMSWKTSKVGHRCDQLERESFNLTWIRDR
ncbi:hypothetical protein I79_014753 [Cricetulus griseus]|uniref:Uncharacterized protein n=1 Tax=Cricetulus griseus TaxID=10029 RepID=G3HUY2_CRIGR|nr:hypothetical protein I79_014753 [Cricetulus griseus]